MVSIAVPPFSEIEIGVIATVAVWEKTLIEILKNNDIYKKNDFFMSFAKIQIIQI